MLGIETDRTIDQLLELWRPVLGTDYFPYRSHVYRVFHISCVLARASPEERDKLAIAAAFHDAGIWLDRTFDYLAPSAQRAADYLSETGREAWTESIHQIIEQHHKVFPWRGLDQRLVESFREADWPDVCLFALPTRLDRIFLADLLRRFPRKGFHWRLVYFALAWARKHPLNPLPILRW